MAIKNTTKEWAMPEWMVKYSNTIGGKNFKTREDIERIYNSNNPVYLLVKARIIAKIEMLLHLESKKLI